VAIRNDSKARTMSKTADAFQTRCLSWQKRSRRQRRLTLLCATRPRPPDPTNVVSQWAAGPVAVPHETADDGTAPHTLSTEALQSMRAAGLSQRHAASRLETCDAARVTWRNLRGLFGFTGWRQAG